ncbi:MAG: ribose-phosphate pyrophosphokinase [Xanthomonadaceae bacterium]|nr:ribose-phosphate pyrophosphokinase [Xanthomonadaceae bacterium]
MLLFSPNHSAPFAREIARHLNVSLGASEEREFDGGEHKMRALEDVTGQDVFVIQNLCGDEHASANDKLCRLLFFAGSLKDAGAARVTACLPYLAYARKDRRTQPNDPTTTRYLAAMFEAVRIDRVIVLDVHNEAAFDNAFRCTTTRIEAMSTFADALAHELSGDGVVVASPDAGGIKRAQRFRETLAARLQSDVGFAFMEKRRAKGVVSGETLVGEVAARDVLIFDDMIASGTTILRAATAARRAGARRVLALASHAAFQPAAACLFESEGPDAVLVSDSLPIRPPFDTFLPDKLRVCSVAPLFARTIAALSSSASPGRDPRIHAPS